ncbi:hypothetical protein [Streptomyces sp. NPDC012888]|uniref:hypothetical protein n=1 Tax=Streptomyces sp. NPDC012888 TaxID=3364855 RepID=UPI00369C71FA
MIHTAIDPTSHAYALGHASGTILITLAAVALLWRLTRTYRRATASQAPLPAAQLPALRQRRRVRVLVAAALITAGGTAKAVADYDPASRKAGTAAEAGTGTTAEVPARTIAAPAQVGRYRLLTGEQAAPYEAQMAGSPVKGDYWVFDADGDATPDGVLSILSVEKSPKLTAEKKRDSTAQQFRNLFAGAKASDVEWFPAGPLGGGLGCGHTDTPAPGTIVCGWIDDYTTGTFLAADATDLKEMAEVTLALRNASDQRS